jgi:hypothetical protein
VEDEWEREIEADEDLDLLFIKYRPDKITVEQLEQTIKEHGFSVEVKEEP